MSSQNDSGIPLFHAPDGIGYRLMELPPDLLEALESENPSELRLEASATSAVLKYGSQSWGLRQKNTSNALIILKPGDMTTPSSQISRASLNVVSTIHDTIELVPEPTGKPAAVTKGKWHEKFARGR
ncbi:putative sister chromatid cohesion protein [Rosellinia necatrix]|uniref:Putative sister chromatid cohesion protein n=1 Tax=Rosellinia necatrix TaxID=77044 RepID=A0A1W2TUL7_ROSNE|nr:putative sister chromatid cohesion protein [Rosellinia necatrix]